MITSAFHPRRVLLAEINSFYGSLLRAEGYETDEVTSGALALCKIQEGHCHVAVLAEDLPDKTGLDVLRATARRHGVPIILISQSYNVQRAVEAIKEGAWDYLPRPIQREDLLRAVAKACQCQRAPVPEISAERKRQAQKMELFGRLASGVIHDFNNLLTVIVGYCGLIRDENCSAIAYVEEIEQVVSNGSALTQQMLAFARNRPNEPQLLDLNFVLLRLKALLARLLGEAIHIELRLVENLGHIRADANQLEQVILNLAVNARDAMPRGGQLTLETVNLDLANSACGLPPGPYVVLKVADTGCGMDDATKARLFEPFFTTKPEGHGTGLGLTTVFSIVACAAGHINVASQPGQGTTFSLAFPQAPETTAKALVMPEPAVIQKAAEPFQKPPHLAGTRNSLENHRHQSGTRWAPD